MENSVFSYSCKFNIAVISTVFILSKNWNEQNKLTSFSVPPMHFYKTEKKRKRACLLSNGPCKKDSTRGNGMRKGANFCTTLLLFYHTSDWLNQQNLPKLQVAVYLFILNWSTIFLSTKSLPSINTAVILCEEHWKIRSFYCLCLRLLWLVEMFPHKGNYLPK